MPGRRAPGGGLINHLMSAETDTVIVINQSIIINQSINHSKSAETVREEGEGEGELTPLGGGGASKSIKILKIVTFPGCHQDTIMDPD